VAIIERKMNSPETLVERFPAAVDPVVDNKSASLSETEDLRCRGERTAVLASGP
jgi:hypothetical protein